MNPTAERLTGWPFATAAGRPLAEVFRIINTSTRQPAPDPVQRVLADGEVTGLANHTALLAADGREYQIADSAAPIHDSAGAMVGVMLVFNDVSEHYRLQQALRRSEERFRTLAESSGDYVARYDRECRHLYLNATALRGLQLTEQQIIGRTLREGGLPDDLCRYCEGHIRQVFATGRLFRSELRWPRPTGVLLLDWHLTPELGANGRVVSVLAVAREATESPPPDAAAGGSEQQRQQAQRLQSLGVLASGIAHDFNNILLAVLGHADLALGAVPATSDAADDLRQIKTAAHRASELCQQMMAYSGQGPAALEPVHLDRLVEEMTRLLKPAVPRKAVLRLQLAADLPVVQANPSQVRQVVLNLVLNACEALGELAGVVVVAASLLHCDAAYLRATALHDGLTPGRYLELEVRDSGCGMDASTLTRVFEPFFTTKARGTGLGLAAVLGIVQAHQGALEVVSEPGRGSTFRVLLPLVQGEACTRELSVEQRPLRGAVMLRCSWPPARCGAAAN